MIPALSATFVPPSYAAGPASAPASGPAESAAAADTTSSEEAPPRTPATPAATGTSQQKEADLRTTTELAATDRRVRTHEAAHLAAAQGLAIGGASFSYETGPDGQRYAVAGEVNIDTSAASTPTETLAKAAQIRRAALAPADPSAQDRAVAAMAERMGANARLELAREQAATYTRTEASTLGRQIDLAA